jgi:hypothetical protein
VEQLGKWAFIIGLIVALIGGFVSTQLSGTWAAVLVILGIVVGFLNVTEKEVSGFLLAAVALIVAGTSNMGVIPAIGANLEAVLGNIVMFVAPAAVVVGIKAVWGTAKKK